MKFKQKLPKLKSTLKENKALLLTENQELRQVIKLTLLTYGYDVVIGNAEKKFQNYRQTKFRLIVYDKNRSDINKKIIDDYKENNIEVEFIAMNEEFSSNKSSKSYDWDKTSNYKVVNLSKSKGND